MICLAIYNALALPMQIAFVAEVKKVYDDSTFLSALENTVDVFFLIDMCLLFLSAYINTTDGETVQ